MTEAELIIGGRLRFQLLFEVARKGFLEPGWSQEGREDPLASSAVSLLPPNTQALPGLKPRPRPRLLPETAEADFPRGFCPGGYVQ